MTLETKQRSRGSTEEVTEYRTDQVIDATVMRITGAGNFIVYPNARTGRRMVRTGNPVRIIVSEKTEKMVRPLVSLEAREERTTTPIASNWAVLVSGRQSIERCRVFYNHVQLNTVDHLGEVKSELRIARDSTLTFRIPDTMEINDTYLVEVKDGERLLRSETFGSIRSTLTPSQKL